MTERATQLLRTAEQQISELRLLASTATDADLRRPCPGREKLGDGTVAAIASHTAETYVRIVRFATGGDATAHTQTRGPDSSYHPETVDRSRLLERLSDARIALGQLAELTDQQLDAVPPAGQARFCDGQRTLETVLTSMLKHQDHQVDALRAAIA